MHKKGQSKDKTASCYQSFDWNGINNYGHRMNFITYIHFTVFNIFVGLAVYTLYKNSKSLFNISLFMLFLSISIWSLGFSIISIEEINGKFPYAIFEISSVVNVNICFAALLSVLAFVGNVMLYRKVLILNIITLGLLAYFQWNGQFARLGSYQENIRQWSVEYGSMIVFWSFGVVYYTILVSIMILLYRYYRKETNYNKARQAKVIFITGLISFVLPVINIHLPQIMDIEIPMFADVFLLVLAYGFLYNIIKYKFFEISPTRYAQNIIEIMPTGLIMADKKNQIVSINPTLAKITGFSKKEILGKDFFGWFTKLTHKPVEEKMIGQEADMQIITKKNKILDIVISTAYLKNTFGNQTGIICVLNDISKLKKTEKELLELNKNLEDKINIRTQELKNETLKAQENEMKLKQFTEMLPETVFEMDQYYRIKYLNYSGQQKFFHKAKKDDLSIFDLFTEREILEYFLKRVFHGATVGSYKLTAKKQDGETFSAILYCRAIEEKEKIIGIRGIIVDISEIEKAERLKNDVKIAEDSASIRQQLLANISHEMRTPMNGILGMTDFLLDTDLDRHQLEFVQTIKDSSESLLNIINDVLDLSKMEQGKLVTHKNYIDFRDLLSKTINIFMGHIKEKRLFLKKQIAEDFPESFLTDKKHLRQILYNLISNAVKYTETGGIIIDAKILENHNKHFVGKISVSDTGFGISSDNIDRIFEPFTRIDEKLTKHIEGTGLGLSITQKLVGLLGGKLSVESEVNKGSTFSFTFQAERCEKQTDQTPQINPISLARLNPSVLVAEDKKVNQKVVRMFLEQAGCKVEIAENGKEVLKKFKSDKYDIILMDIMMPEMDGITTLKNLKTQYKTLPPVIGLSAFAMEGDAGKYIDQGLDDYLEKPINKNRLIEKIFLWMQKMPDQ